MRPQQLLKRISTFRQNVRFSDALTLARSLGFQLDHTEGSHHILRHPSVPELLNLQEVRGQAKPYQLKQLLHLIERYNLTLGEHE
ncbi:MAG: hypothetical protein C3F08_10125 [Candidatus Methylomirabilota bacterium]|nr:MAG: hypothetical protein C3F08_10125 [candidate division NC10 bacterium]